jgi:hypothetical protein
MQNISTFLIQQCADLYASIWLRKVTSLLMTVGVLASGILQIFQNPEIIRIPALVSDFLRGVNTNKCECVNKMTMIIDRRMFIS